MSQPSIIEQSQRYPTQAEIQAAMERAHQLRSETFRSALVSLTRVFALRGRAPDASVCLPQPVRAVHY